MDFHWIAQASPDERKAMIARMDRTSRIRYYRWMKRQREREKNHQPVDFSKISA